MEEEEKSFKSMSIEEKRAYNREAARTSQKIP